MAYFSYDYHSFLGLLAIPAKEMSKTPRPPMDLLHLHEQFWGKSLDPSLTTIPTNESMIADSADLCETQFDDQLSDCILSEEPFIMDMKPQFFVRADYVRLFNEVQTKHRLYHETGCVI
ncbi:7801_t:CDS:2, partial [Acaulospora colombiana]